MLSEMTKAWGCTLDSTLSRQGIFAAVSSKGLSGSTRLYISWAALRVWAFP